MFITNLFFPKSLHIKLVLAQAAQLSIHFLFRKNQQCCTFLRDLIKDTPLRDRKRRKKSITRRKLNPRSQEFCSTGLCSTTVQQPLPTTLPIYSYFLFVTVRTFINTRMQIHSGLIVIVFLLARVPNYRCTLCYSYLVVHWLICLKYNKFLNPNRQRRQAFFSFGVQSL